MTGLSPPLFFFLSQPFIQSDTVWKYSPLDEEGGFVSHLDPFIIISPFYKRISRFIRIKRVTSNRIKEKERERKIQDDFREMSIHASRKAFASTFPESERVDIIRASFVNSRKVGASLKSIPARSPLRLPRATTYPLSLSVCPAFIFIPRRYSSLSRLPLYTCVYVYTCATWGWWQGGEGMLVSSLDVGAMQPWGGGAGRRGRKNQRERKREKKETCARRGRFRGGEGAIRRKGAAFARLGSRYTR